MQQATRNRFALYSQSVQEIFCAFLGTIETTRRLRREHLEMRMKYPWRTKHFYPVHWPAQAVCKQKGRVILPMGKGRKSLALPLDLPDHAGACSLVWNDGFELHGCIQNQVGTLFIGNPHGVRNRDADQHHNSRIAQWEYGKDIDYLTHKSNAVRISCSTGSERGTSSRCPPRGHRHKPKGRTWACRACGFRGHRDLVGSVNMHRLAFGMPVEFPRSFTYLRPGLTRTRSSRAAP